jgi:hypothetical protein
MGKLKKIAKFMEDHAEFIVGVAVGYVVIPFITEKITHTKLPIQVKAQASIDTAE